ncbi:UDP-N-acetylmuramate--L-alanine ligase [Parapedobacter koreensis]|uniref:UDP-N-acetylmuramate--L-alanine ligase n=1 Tax=Parapedobacter koreensis TaxID=332977 RepID=A0A1H7PDL2_9SPHI|nr:UDP-N-acetylmuramate--L-alanine ligase [Parapedobacter koreensis]SEL33177.1 UDP-N-acetylmuramate--L-alanine ligase [Parapedobacter koreensis]
MNIDNIKQVYLIGIGGIGMSALARYFRHLGCLVAGYDKTETTLTMQLVAEGIPVIYSDDFSQVDDAFKIAGETTLIIYTPAVPSGLGILNQFNALGHTLFKRSQVLGLISQRRFTIAVAGTHGKTTTSTLVAHLLKDSGYDCSAFLGGISTNYNSNVLFSDNNVVVVEADEYDRSFLTLHPDIAVVTSADADHLDIYGDKGHLEESFSLFLHQVQADGTTIVKIGLPFEATIRYAADRPTDAYAENIHIANGTFYFDYVWHGGRMDNLHLGVPGQHNIENAVAAITIAHQLGIGTGDIRSALSSFAGVKRRFEYIVNTDGTVYIDDYAHHPEELRAFLTAVKQLYPSSTLTAVFQPHLYTRTRDFADGFAEALSMVDTLLLMDIYPARELPIAGVDSQMLLDKVALKDKRLATADEVKEYVRINRPGLLVTMGAGDIDLLVKPLKTILTHV